MILPVWVKPTVYAVAAAAIFGAGYAFADALGDAALAKAQRDWGSLEKSRLDSAIEVDRKRRESVRHVEYVYVEGAERVRTETKVITNEVIKYVQSPAIARVYLPAEWVRLHDAAATGNVSASDSTSGVDDGRPVAVDDAEAIAVIAYNYNQCRAAREQVTGLKAYARTVSGEP